MEKIKGFKTLIFAIIVAVLGVLETFDWISIFDGESGGIWVSVIGIVIAFLRKITTTPMLKNA
jgi:hypothetical protein